MEGLSLAEKNGCDPRAVVAMLTETLFPAPWFGGGDIGRKDLGLFQKTGAQVGSPTPLANFMLGGSPSKSDA